MQIEVNGTRLWFDVDGPALVSAGPAMRDRPTLILVHGGPATYDHSYFKPSFGRLADQAQVVYLDLRGHGRSAWGDARDWDFVLCADDLRAFCDALGIDRPIVLGHSMGGIVAMLYGARHPAHPRGLILQSTMARFDLDRLVSGFRRFADDDVAELARRDYGGHDVTDAEWARVFAAFGPSVPSKAQLARIVRNPDLGGPGMALLRRLDIVSELTRIECATLVSVGDRDPVTPVEAAREIFAALRPGIGRLEVIDGVGHFPWLDAPDQYAARIGAFVATLT